MKFLTAVFFFLVTAPFCHSQTLFSYGSKQVSKTEFLNAFHKNNTESAEYQTAITDYLELYTRFKLKVQAAYDARMDTLPNQKADILGFRRQIEEPYMTDTIVLKRLTDEAFLRSQKEIGLSHIFIPFRQDFEVNPFSVDPITKTDSLAAQKKLQQVTDRLKSGEQFDAIARSLSGDPASASKGGRLGYITVFTLPYAMENVVYSLADQQVSDPVGSVKGYHIFKKTGEQSARGRMKAAQILIAFEENATPAQKAVSLKLADSLYASIKAGSDFEDITRRFSNDKNTLATGGLMPEFGIGQFEQEFEDKVFGLRANGEITRPIETSFGYHIVKKIEGIPVEKNKSVAYPLMKAAVLEDPRNTVARQSFEKQVLVRTGYKKAPYDPESLWRMTDSFNLANKTKGSGTLNEKSALFSFSNRKITAGNWLQYSRENWTGEGRKSYPAMMQQFVGASSLAYYREHLEDYNSEFRSQLQEFADGNLLFEIMEKEVWNKAATDSAGLRNYYEQHKGKYQWGPSVNAIIFNASEKKSAEEYRLLMQQNPSGWRSFIESSGGRLTADSARFDITQITDTDAALLKPGFLSPIQENETDKSASFYHIVNVYMKSALRNFNEARGMVMNDYQLALEEKWIAQLKRKYPVKVNPQVWKEIIISR
jgi:peptidyl-prolyl cis-trans isomerase SurA